MLKSQTKKMSQAQQTAAITQIVVDKHEEKMGFYLVSIIYQDPNGLGHWLRRPYLGDDNKIMVHSTDEVEAIRATVEMLTGHKFFSDQKELNGLVRYVRER